MAGTLTIPLTTLQNGARTFGPSNVADADADCVLTIDRTVSAGLNSLTSTSTIEILVEQSNDGGTTWFLIVDGIIFGGAQPAFRSPGNATSSAVTVTFEAGTSRKVRATMTVTNGPIVVQGTLTTS